MSTALSATTLTGEEIVALCRRHTIFEWSPQSKADPIPVARAEGVYFYTPEGKRYLDFNSQLMCSNIGHSHPKVVKAIQEQAAVLAYANPFLATEPRARLGAKLAEIAPGDIDTFFFTNGGAEANENAIRIARVATGRHKILARYRSYHGGTAGAISLTGDPRRWAAEPGLPGIVRAPEFHKWGAQGAGAGRRVPARARGRDPLRGRPEHRGVPDGDGGRHERPPDPARRLPAGRARDLRPPRHPADRRRGDVGLRPHRRVVRGRPLEGRARHHHDGQGHHLGLRAARRRGPAAAARQGVPGARLPGRPHLQQPPARLRHGARDDRASTRRRA